METTIHAKYYLNDEQVNHLIDAGMTTKINWYVRNMTTNQFVNYTSMLGIERVKGNTALNLVFPEGTFEEGTELKAAVGDWNVMDANGRHCLQTAFFYINGEGQAISCKYSELPSQNGGVVPQLPESEQPTAAVNTQQATLETVPVVQAKSSECKCDCEYLCYSSHVVCDKYDEIYRALDACSEFVSDSPDCADSVCMECKHHKNLYVKKSA